MKKIIFSSLLLLSLCTSANELNLLNFDGVSNNETFQKNEILKKLLIQDGILSVVETDKVIISIALMDAKKNKDYIKKVNDLYDNSLKTTSLLQPKTQKEKDEDVKKDEKIKTNKQNNEAKILASKIETMDNEISLLVKNNTQLLEVNKLLRESYSKQQTKLLMMEERIMLLETKLINLENPKQNTDISHQVNKKFFPVADKQYDNNWIDLK